MKGDEVRRCDDEIMVLGDIPMKITRQVIISLKK
jgi:hypothetical protein